MDNLLKEIRRVQRRLALQRFLGVLGWCWFASLLAAAVVIGAARFYPLGIVDWQWLAGFLAAGLVAAIGWTFWAVTPSSASRLGDRSSLRAEGTRLQHPGHASGRPRDRGRPGPGCRHRRPAAADRRAGEISRSPAAASLLAAAAGAAAGGGHDLPSAHEGNEAEATETAATQPPLEVKKSADDLRQKLVERRKQAEKEGLKDATELLKRLEEGTKELQTQTQREKALVKLNDLARELQERRKQLGGGRRGAQAADGKGPRHRARSRR